MAYPEVLIPPSVRPESPVEIEPIDDQTVLFSPQFARGLSQRQTWGDPLWGMRLRYKGLSQEDRALLKSAIAASRGKGANLRVTPGLPLRGSFAATELLANNTFASGTTGWTAARCTLSAADRVLRLTNTKSGGANNFAVSQSGLTVTQYAAYALRSMISALSRSGMSNGTSMDAGNYAVDRAGLVTQAEVQLSASSGAIFPGVFDTVGTVSVAGDYAELSWTSLTRCPLVDNAPNALLQSDALGTTWTATRSSVTANSVAAPDGTTTADTINEDGTAAQTHFISQAVTVSSTALDYSFSCSLKAGTRSWAQLQLIEGTSNHELRANVNLATGALGTVSAAGANWTNARGFVVAEGDGWYRLTVVGRKASAATTISAIIAIGEADADITFSGLSAASMYAWRASLAQSSFPVRGALTTTTATTGTTQTSNRLYVKGLPASTSGLLLAGDFVDVNGELERVIAPLDSNAAGLGVLILGRRRAVAPADNDPVIVLNPMGRFMVQAVRETERYGLYTDIELDLIEAPA